MRADTNAGVFVEISPTKVIEGIDRDPLEVKRSDGGREEFAASEQFLDGLHGLREAAQFACPQLHSLEFERLHCPDFLNQSSQRGPRRRTAQEKFVLGDVVQPAFVLLLHLAKR